MGAQASEISPADVQARFRWARKRGMPFWLWPEVCPERWSAALEQIDRCARHILAARPGPALLEGEADALGIAAFTSGMGPLLGYWTRAGQLDARPDLKLVCESHFAHNAERMKRLQASSVAVVDALAKAGVKVTVLKGMHTAYGHFPVPGCRPVSDIDLLIDRSAEQAANLTLKSLGYRPEAASPGERTWRMQGTPKQPRSLSLVHQDSPWSVDLHTSLDRRYSPGSPTVGLDRALQFGGRVAWPLSPNGEALTGAGLVLHLAGHASLNLTSLSMIRLTELVLVIRRLEKEDSLSWDEFLGATAMTGVPGSCYPALHFANIFAPGVVPERVLRTIGRQTPRAVRRVLAPLTPATCHRLLRFSLTERFMWIGSLGNALREASGTVFPAGGLRQLVNVYRYRLALLLGGRITP